MLIMTLFVLSIGFNRDIMNLIENFLNAFNELDGFLSFILNLCKLCLCSFKSHYNIIGTQWLKYQAHLKRVVAS